MINYWMTLQIEKEKHELRLAQMKAVLIDSKNKTARRISDTGGVGVGATSSKI